MYAPTVLELMILEFLSGSNDKKQKYTSVRSAAFFSVISEDRYIGESSISTIRRAINSLVSYGFVDYGVRSGKFYTYFITEKGLQFLNEQ